MRLSAVLGRLFEADLIRFCIVGGITAGVQLGLYSLLLDVHIFYELSSAISMLVSTFLAYLGNRIWTFHSSRRWWRELIEYSISRIATIALNELILYCLVEYVGVGKFISQVVSVVAITIINYAVGKLVVFRKGLEIDDQMILSRKVVPVIPVDGE